MTRFQFVADHQDAYEVKRLCELVEIELSSFYAWQAAAQTRAARAAADAQLAERIREVHEVHEQDNTMGAPRITAELNDDASQAQRVNHKRVARVMRQEPRLPASTPGAHHGPGAGEPEGARPGQAGLHRPRGEPALCRGHHLPAHCRRHQPVPGHGDRLLLATAGRLVGRGPHAHRAHRGRARGCRGDPRQPGRRDLPFGPRIGLCIERFRHVVCRARRDTVDGAVGTSTYNSLAEAFNATFKREVLQDESSPDTTPVAGTPGAGTRA